MTGEEGSFELDIGTYTGATLNNRPHGNGTILFKPEDAMGRRAYEGDWREGAKTGKGRMTFVSGDFYEGDFVDGVPDGEGRFHYPESGEVETAAFERGRRHGLSRCRTPGGTEEEIPYVDGVARGTATLRMADGGVEERTYENGVKQGPATVTLANGYCVKYTYRDDVLDGPAEYACHGGRIKERCSYVAGVKRGPSTEWNERGDEEERVYVAGVLEGPAILKGAEGDRLEFTYKNGKRSGAATYWWSDGSKEVSLYDESGVENGPCKLIWANGASREGEKRDGLWDGHVFYTYAEGPRKGKKDVEEWKAGELVSSKKYHGDGEEWEVESWDDLKDMEEATKNYAPCRRL